MKLRPRRNDFQKRKGTKMNSREAFRQTLGMEQDDYVPFFPRDLTLGMDSLDVSTASVFGNGYDPKLSAECVLALQKFLNSDATVGCIAGYSLEAFGGVMKYTDRGVPYASGYPFEDFGRIELFQPSDIRKGFVAGMRDASEIVREKRPDLALVTNIPGPVTISGFARGLETLMMDLLTNEDVAEKILDFCTEALIEEMDLLSDGISDAVFFASASDNPDMIGEDGYRRYSLKNIKRINDAVHSRGLPSIYHPHGVFSTEDRQHLLKESIDVGIDGFQFAEGNEPEGILEICDGRCAVLGGVTAYTTLLLGPEKRIIRDTDRYLSAFEGTSYIMTCSCSLNRGQPLDNLKIMTDHLHEYNRGRR